MSSSELALRKELVLWIAKYLLAVPPLKVACMELDVTVPKVKLSAWAVGFVKLFVLPAAVIEVSSKANSSRLLLPEKSLPDYLV